MRTTLIYMIFVVGAVLVSSFATRYMTKRKVSPGVRKFVVSTIGALAMLCIWLILNYT